MSGPSTLRVAEQLELLGSALPEAPARLLDVGCGDGRLAAALQARGYAVVGIDPDPDAVARAVGRGVEAVETDLARFDDAAGFDAVVFSTSLHHMPELSVAMDRVSALLSDEGVLVVDEFAHDDADAATAAFFFGLRDLLLATGVAVHQEHDHGHGHREHDQGHHQDPGPEAAPLDRWRADHQHDPPLHGGEAMLRQLRGSFDIESVGRVPYLWAYLSEIVEDTPRGDSATVAVRELEQRLVAAGTVRPLGLRVVGRAR